MFVNPYFTEEDARRVQGFLAMLFPLHFRVQYQGIYGEIGTPGKLAYWVYVEQKGHTRYINNLTSLQQWLIEELDEEQSQEVLILFHSV